MQDEWVQGKEASGICGFVIHMYGSDMRTTTTTTTASIYGKRKTLCKHHLIALGIKNVLHTFHQFTIILQLFFRFYFYSQFFRWKWQRREERGEEWQENGPIGYSRLVKLMFFTSSFLSFIFGFYFLLFLLYIYISYGTSIGAFFKLSCSWHYFRIILMSAQYDAKKAGLSLPCHQLNERTVLPAVRCLWWCQWPKTARVGDVNGNARGWARFNVAPVTLAAF